jgi:hypothetical protein
MRTRDEKIRDVRSILDAARAVRDARAEHRDALARAAGLSSAGIDLALDEHLEVDATDAEIGALVDGAGDAPEVAVILSANVFVAALRALAIARAASTRVIVRPSSREPVFVRALLQAANDPAFELRERFEPRDLARGEIHVYGRDETIAAVRAAAVAGVRVVGHGAGMGVAIVSAPADLGKAAEELAPDVVAFDQRGCLSPRLVLVEGDLARADAFAEALHAALAAWQARVPRGALFEAEEARRWTETVSFVGRVWRADDHVVATGPEPALPPAGRHVHVSPFIDRAALAAKLGPFARWIVAVGADDLDLARAVSPAHARLSPLGRMQKPPLDGPVDRRVTAK